MSSPLIEATGLVPGVRVLLKDETVHASGSHKEPAARSVVARARNEGRERVFVGSCGNFGRATAISAQALGVGCTVVLPPGNPDSVAFMTAAGAEVIVIDGTYEEAVAESKRLAQESGQADGNVDGPYADEILRGHGQMVDALQDELADAPDGLWLPIGNGTTIRAAHLRQSELGWSVPLYGVGPDGTNNAVVTSWPGEYRMLGPDEVVTTEENQPLVNWHALHGPEAMAAISATGGQVYSASDDELLAAQKIALDLGVQASPSGAASLAGLLARDDLSGTHVALISGR